MSDSIEPITKKERQRARHSRKMDKWQLFQSECKDLAQGTITQGMSKYYRKYKNDVEDGMDERTAWNNAIQNCVSGVAPTVIPKRKPRSPIEIKTKKIQLPPPIDTEGFKRAIVQQLAEHVKEQEQRTSRRFERLNNAIQRLGMSGEDNKQFVKKIMKDAANDAVTAATENVVDTTEQLQNVTSKIKQNTNQAITSAVNEIGQQINQLNDRLERKLNEGLEKIKETVQTAQTAQAIQNIKHKTGKTDGLDELPFELEEVQRASKVLTSKEMDDKIAEIEGVCEQMFPIKTDIGLERKCNRLSNDPNACALESGGNCYYHEPGFLGGIFGDQAQCKAKEESLALIPSQLDEYIQCKTERGEEVSEKLLQLQPQPQPQPQLQSQSQSQPQPQQPADPGFQQLIKAKDSLHNLQNIVSPSESEIQQIQQIKPEPTFPQDDILDQPKEPLKLPPLLTPTQTDVLPAPPVQPPEPLQLPPPPTPSDVDIGFGAEQLELPSDVDLGFGAEPLQLPSDVDIGFGAEPVQLPSDVDIGFGVEPLQLPPPPPQDNILQPDTQLENNPEIPELLQFGDFGSEPQPLQLEH